MRLFLGGAGIRFERGVFGNLFLRHIKVSRVWYYFRDKFLSRELLTVIQ